MSRGRFRLAVLLASVAASAACVWALVNLRARAPRTAIVDTSDGIRGLFKDLLEVLVDSRPKRGELGWPPPVAIGSIDEVTAKLIWPAIGTSMYEFDSELYVRVRPNLSFRSAFDEHPEGGFRRVSNSLGLRQVGEIASAKPALRVLVTGASNVEGVCATEETAVKLLEAALRERLSTESIEVLNAGVGGYNFFNYLAVLRHHAALAPDVFVVVVYGGTDFRDTAVLARYFDRRGPPNSFVDLATPMLESDSEFARDLCGTELSTAMYFERNPRDVDYAFEAAAWITSEVERLSRDQGVALVCAYLPPPLRGQPQYMEATRTEVLARVALDETAYEISDQLADLWLSFLVEREIAHVDLRAAFRDSQARCYWDTDTHINLTGQRALADELFPKVLEAARAGGIAPR